MRHLLDAAVAAGARRFVSESFFGVYGFGPYERPRTEDDPIGRERNRGIQAVIDAIAVVRGPGPRRQRRAAHRRRVAALRRLPRPAGAEHGRDGRARAQAPAAGHRRPRRDDADGRARRRRARGGRRARARARRADLQRRRRRAGGHGRLPGRARARRRRAAAAPRAVLARPRRRAVRGDVHGPRARADVQRPDRRRAGLAPAVPDLPRGARAARCPPSISRRSARAGPARWPRSAASRAASRCAAPTPGPGSSRRPPARGRRWSRAAGGRGRASRP